MRRLSKEEVAEIARQVRQDFLEVVVETKRISAMLDEQSGLRAKALRR